MKNISFKVFTRKFFIKLRYLISDKQRWVLYRLLCMILSKLPNKLKKMSHAPREFNRFFPSYRLLNREKEQRSKATISNYAPFVYRISIGDFQSSGVGSIPTWCFLADKAVDSYLVYQFKNKTRRHKIVILSCGIGKHAAEELGS